MTTLQAAVLGLIQGLTEFLPVSSSGHLVLAEQIMHVEAHDITFEVALHFGTLMAVLTIFRKDLFGLVRSLFHAVGRIREADSLWKNDPYFRLGIGIVVGSVPAAIIGLAFEDAVEGAFSSPFIVSICLIVTGTVLWITRYAKMSKTEVRLSDAVIIGIAQAIAILPGVSRSGSTISTGLLRGVGGVQATRFSFLLAVPVILGASVLKLGAFIISLPAFSQSLPLITGGVVAYISGYMAITLALDVVRKGKLEYFGYYCWLVGVVGIVVFR